MPPDFSAHDTRAWHLLRITTNRQYLTHGAYMVKVALMVENKKMTEAQDEAIRVVLSDGGRIVIPASVRKALGVGPGDSLSLRVEDKELRILPQREAIRRAQEIVSRRVASGRSLVKELSEERKLEASRG